MNSNMDTLRDVAKKYIIKNNIFNEKTKKSPKSFKAEALHNPKMLNRIVNDFWKLAKNEGKKASGKINNIAAGSTGKNGIKHTLNNKNIIFNDSIISNDLSLSSSSDISKTSFNPEFEINRPDKYANIKSRFD